MKSWTRCESLFVRRILTLRNCQEPVKSLGGSEGKSQVEQNCGAGTGLTESSQCIIMRSVNALLIPAAQNLNLVRSRGAPG